MCLGNANNGVSKWKATFLLLFWWEMNVFFSLSFLLWKALSIVTNCCSLFFLSVIWPFFSRRMSAGNWEGGGGGGRRRKRKIERDLPLRRRERERKRGKEEKGEEWLFTRLTGHTGHAGKVCARFSLTSLILVVQLLLNVLHTYAWPCFTNIWTAFLRYVPAIFLRKWGQGESLNPPSILKLLNTG